MSSQPQTAVAAAAGSTSALWDYFELTKPNVIWLILMSTMVGFYVASPTQLPYVLMLHTVGATALLAAGTGALNQWWERDLDAKMPRTENRPLPSGRLGAGSSLAFGLAVSAAGVVYMWAAVNPLSAVIGLLTLAGYVLVYTPLKTRSPLATFVGASPGAAPLLLGWTAARNDLGLEACVLFSILFLWQFPHFYAIGWMYRDDYARAGIRMLPVIETDGGLDGAADRLLRRESDPRQHGPVAAGAGRTRVRRGGSDSRPVLPGGRRAHGSRADRRPSAQAAAGLGHPPAAALSVLGRRQGLAR